MNSTTTGASQASLFSATREMNNLEERKEIKKKKQVLPEKIKEDVVHCAWKYGILEAITNGSSKYPQHEFKRETARDWKTILEDHFRKENKIRHFFSMKKVDRSPLVPDEMLNITKIKSILSNL